MSLFAKHKDSQFGVGDKIKVYQRIKEADKERLSIFEGMVISISGRDSGISFTVRKIGEAGVGIEKIFPLFLPTIEKIEVLKKGTPGVRHAKLFYTRKKPAREIESIYARAGRKNRHVETKRKTAKRKAKHVRRKK